MWRKCLSSAAAGLLIGCRSEMVDQEKVEPLEASPFFADGRGSRGPVEGTVPRGGLEPSRVLREGRSETPVDGGDDLVDYLPFPATREVLDRGRERFDVFCAPCHGRTGDGDGMIVRRGFRAPPSMHSDRVREAKLGALFDVVTRGLGSMPPYSPQIPARDRWAIVAYVRALELSRRAGLDDVPPEERARLVTAPLDPAAPAEGGP